MYKFDVKNFGAAGNGEAIDTDAVQAAIHECGRAGGGRVIVPSGTYICGTLELDDNVDLHLSPGAVILGSADSAHYTDRYQAPYDIGSKAENASPFHLIVAWKKKNIAISGSGTIDGSGPAILGPPVPSPIKEAVFDKTGRWRPSQMVSLTECEQVRIENVTFQNSPYWTIWPYACRDLVIRGIRIRNDWRTPNGDGIDVDLCCNTLISDCDISAGDDAIAVRANRAKSGLDMDLENLVITNCILDTPLGGLRFGPSGELSKIRDVTVSNCVIKNADCGLLFSLGRYPAAGWELGVLIENIRISNVVINSNAPLIMYIADGCGGPCGFRNVAISNVTAYGGGGCALLGNDDCVFEDIRIRDFHLTPDKIETGRCKHVLAQNAFYAKNVKRLSLRDVHIDTRNCNDADGKTIVSFENVEELDSDGF